jgi:hypothetical protein
MRRMSGGLRKSPGFWALALGAVGGAAGFFGPMLLSPDANQGPMLGLFITGPGGALAGLVLGFVFRFLPFTDSVRLQALTFFGTVLGLGTLWFSLPEPVAVANVIEGTIGRCRQPAALVPAAIAHWEDRAARYPDSPQRENWRADTERMLHDAHGVIVEIELQRRNAVIEHRKPWNRGRLATRGWKTERGATDYFGAGTCDSYPNGRHVLLALTSHGTSGWPPEDLPMFLGLLELQPLSASQAKLLK